jgi:hypothetical protein
MIFRSFSPNPGIEVPDWSIDIRELMAMLFVGIAALFLIQKDHIQEAMYLLLPLTGYAIGRTIPMPTKRLTAKENKETAEH